MSARTIAVILPIVLFSPLVCPQPHAGSLLPVGQVEYEFVYDRIERGESQTRDRFDYQLGPYGSRAHSVPHHPFGYLFDTSRTNISLFAFSREDFLSRKESRAEARESFRAGFAAQPLRRLSVYANFVLDERRALDPNYHGKKWRGLAGDVEQAFGQFQSDHLDITFGRFASFWGPRHSLVLAARTAMDGLAWQLRLGRLTVSYRLGRLDGLSPKFDSVPQFENRYFAGHRLDLHLWRNRISLGLFETAVFGGPGRQVDLYYLNPLIFYHGAQLNEGTEDNTLIGFDFRIKPKYGLKLYGQLLVDDLQIEKKSQGDEEPNQYGLLVGGYLTDVVPSWDVRCEYTRVTNWTFNQLLPRNRYLFEGTPIGAATGNDYDQGTIQLHHWFGEQRRLTLTLGYGRRGEGSVTAPWTAPWLEIDGDYRERFPTGTAEKQFTVSLGGTCFLWNHFYLDGEAGVNHLTNQGHIAGESATLPFIRLTLSAFASTLLDLRE